VSQELDEYEDYLRVMKKNGFEPLLSREQFSQSLKEKDLDSYREESQATVRNQAGKGNK